MCGRIKDLWQGEIPLWKVFWLYGICVLLLFSFAFIRSQESPVMVSGRLSRYTLYVDYFMALIFALYQVFLMVVLWRSARKYRGSRILSLSSKVMMGFAGLWFTGNIALYLFLKTLTPPAIEPMINSTPEPLLSNYVKLTDPSLTAQKINFRGMSITFPLYDNIIEVVPMFIDHQLNEIMIKMKNGGYFLFEGTPILHFPKAKQSFIFYSRLQDFSWWNIFYNIRLSTNLMLKLISIPVYGNNQRIYDLQTPYIKGFLRVGNGKADKLILNLSFERQDTHYSLVFMNFGEKDVNELIRTLSTVHPISNDDKSIDQKDIKCPELAILSMMSSEGLTKGGLQKLLEVIEQKRYRSSVIASVREEIEFLSH